MLKKITARHIRSVALVLGTGAVASAASYMVSRPVPIYENNQLQQIANFVAHDNGWPLPYYHYACFPKLSCQQYLDWWAVAMNIGFWAIVAGLVWYAYHRIVNGRRVPKRTRR